MRNSKKTMGDRNFVLICKSFVIGYNAFSQFFKISCNSRAARDSRVTFGLRRRKKYLLYDTLYPNNILTVNGMLKLSWITSVFIVRLE